LGGSAELVRLRAWHAALVLPLVLVALWLMQRGRGTREDPANVLRALRAAHGPTLPAARSAGAAARSETSSYDRETLYEYIDGAAEAYLGHGFERCVVADYTFAGEADASLEITAEVYRFTAPVGANEQMLAERPLAAAPVASVAGALGDATTLVAARGRDYLKLTALTEGRDARKALASLAAAWVAEQP
jgi:hypothetical protein